MNTLRMALPFATAELTDDVPSLLIRTTLVLLVAWIVHALLARANPRWRILLWRAAAVCLVVIGAFAVAGPLVTLPVLPVVEEVTTTPAVDGSSESPSEVVATGPPFQPAPGWNTPPVRVMGTDPPTALAPAGNRAASPNAVPSSDAAAAIERPHFLMTGLFVVWIAGVAIGVLHTVVGFLRMRGICQSGDSVPNWIEAELGGIGRRFSTRTSITIRQTNAVATPCNMGFLRGTILLPKSLCDEARREELQAALFHEAAHFHGGDLKWNHLLHAITVLLWFHPLTWRIRIAHADACDERCDAEAADYLGSSEIYGRSLARIALAAMGRTGPAAMAMTRRRGVSRRIDVLRRGVGRNGLGRRSIATVWGVTAFFILAVAGIGLGRSAAGDPDLNDATMSDEATSAAANDSDKSQKETNDEPGANWDLDLATPKTITGRVVDADGKPVAAARLWWVVARVRPEAIVTGTTDEQGRFTLSTAATKTPETLRQYLVSDTIWVYKEGMQMMATRAGGIIQLPEQPRELLVRLERATDTSFVVTTPDDTPVADALVEPFHFRTYQGYDIIPQELRARLGGASDAEGRVRMPEMPREGFHSVRTTTERFGTQDQSVGVQNPPAEQAIRLSPIGRIEGRLVSDAPSLIRGIRLWFESVSRYGNGYAEVTTDEQGRFLVPAMAAGRLGIYVAGDTDAPAAPRFPEESWVRAGETTTLEIPLERTVLVRGTIRTRDSDQPVPGAEISVNYGVGRQSATVISENDGRYEARVLAGQVGTQVIVLPGAFIKNYTQIDTWDEKVEVFPGDKPFDLPPIRLTPTTPLKGRLIDQHGRPVANVLLSGVKDDRNYGFAETDENGEFSMPVPESIELESYRFSFDDYSLPVTPEVIDEDPLTLRAVRPGN